MFLAAGCWRWRRSRLPRDRAVVLVYHHVTGGSDGTGRRWAPFQRGVSQERFERQIRFLREAMSPVSLREVVAGVRGEKALPPRAVAVTFDDGYLDNYTVAYPILRKYGIPATVFVTTGFIETGQAFWWDQVYSMLRDTPRQALEGDLLAGIARGNGDPRRGSPLTTRSARVRAAETMIDLLRTLPPEGKRAGLARMRSELGLAPDAAGEAPSLMAWAHLRDLRGSGVIIESHTHTHPILGLDDPRVIEEELSTSKQMIETQLNQAVEGLAYPDGRQGTYNDVTIEISKAVGYRFGCTTIPTSVGPGANPFSIGRLAVGNVAFPVFVWELLLAYTAS